MTAPRVLAMANQKGGVGKTTTCINLGAAMAAIGAKVLILDMDPQGNASTGLGVPASARERTTYDVIMEGMPLEEASLKTLVPGLTLVPSDPDLAGVELELAGRAGKAFRLREAVARADNATFDYVLIDCPPSLNILTLNSLAASDGVLVPLQCEFFALEGLTQLLRTIDQVKGSLNPKLRLQGVALTMFDRRNGLAVQVARDVRAHLGEAVYESVIPRNVRLSEAPSFGKPAIIYDLKCAGSRAYLSLAAEVLRRERALKLEPA